MMINIQAKATKRGEYHYAKLEIFNEQEKKPLKVVVYHEPFINKATALKHAQFAAHELCNRYRGG